MSLTATQVNEAFVALGQSAPSAALLASIMAIPNNYDALNAIIALPQVQSADIPVVSMFDLALGHDPSSATLSSMVSGGASLAATASAFVASQSFANVYNGGVILNPNTIVSSANNSIITALFLNGLGHAPTPATLADFNGLTLAQAFLDFTTSSTVAVSATVNASILQILELATGIPASVNPPPTQSFTLTNGQDTVISGQNTVGTTAPGTLVIQSTVASPENTVINAPLSGPFGNQPTLTSADDINLSASVGGANTLNATFDGTDIVTGLTIKGAQTWNIQQTGLGASIVALEGTAGSIDGVTTLNYTGNGLTPGEFLVGITGGGIDATTPASGFNLGVSNAPGAGGGALGVEVVFASAAFTGGDVINVTANAVGNALSGTSHTFGDATQIAAGSMGANGFAVWNVASTGANSVNDIALSAEGSKKATTLNLSDDGSATWVWSGGDAADWANLTTINAALTTGNLTVTGHENGGNGLLADDTSALTSVTGGAGADTFDLSAFGGAAGGSVAGLSINGGANTTIELSNTEVNFLSGAAAFASWTNVAVLDVVASPTVGGPINMAEFPGTLTVSLLSTTSGLNPNQGSDITVTKAPDGLNFDFNDTNQHGHNFSATGTDTAGGSGNVLNVNYDGAVDSTGSFSSSHFDFVNIGVNTGGAIESFYSTHVTAVANADAAETLTINATGGGELNVGNSAGGTLGTDTITLLGGAIIVNPPSATFTDTGTLDISGNAVVQIGVTNASTIDYTGSNEFFMNSPDNFVQHGQEWVPGSGISVTSDTPSVLQGSLGAGFVTGNDVITDDNGGSQIFGDGGADTINVGNTNNIWFGSFSLNDFFARLPIVQSGDANPGFWGVSNTGHTTAISSLFVGPVGGTSADMTTVNGFSLDNGSTLNFNVDAWNAGVGNGGGGLTNLNTMTSITASSALGNTVDIGAPGQVISSSADFIIDSIGTYANANALATALSQETIGNFVFGHNLSNSTIIDFLVAYNTGTGINIADVDLHNASGGNIKDTAAATTIFASDMVHLTGVTSLTDLGNHLSDIAFNYV